MSLKNIIKASFITFSKFSKEFFAFCFASTVLIGSLLFLSTIIDNMIASFVLTFILVGISFPILVSFKYIVLKGVDRKDIITKDFYFGFKNYRVSVLATTRELTGLFLWSLLGFFVGSMIGGLCGTFYIMANNPEILSSIMSSTSGVDYTEIIEKVSKLSYVEVISDVTMLLGVLFGGIFYSFFSGKLNYSCFMKFETAFSFENTDLYSKEFLTKNKGSYGLLNLIFFIFVYSVVLLGFGLIYVFSKLELNEYIIYSIVMFLSTFLISLVVLLYELALAHSYNHYLRNEVKNKNQEYLVRINKKTE